MMHWLNMSNKTIASFIKDNWALIGNFIWPIVVSSVIFFADSRYLKKEDFTDLVARHQVAYKELSNEQREALTKLTNAISALTEQSRQNSESVKVLLSQREDVLDRLSKHEVVDSKLYDLLDQRVIRLEKR